MIETEQTVVIDLGIDRVWSYVQDIHNWANFMPGLKEYTVVDKDELERDGGQCRTHARVELVDRVVLVVDGRDDADQRIRAVVLELADDSHLVGDELAEHGEERGVDAGRRVAVHRRRQ